MINFCLPVGDNGGEVNNRKPEGTAGGRRDLSRSKSIGGWGGAARFAGVMEGSPM